MRFRILTICLPLENTIFMYGLMGNTSLHLGIKFLGKSLLSGVLPKMGHTGLMCPAFTGFVTACVGI